MGLRTAAAILGFRLKAAASNKKITSSSLSLFTRSTSSLATTTPGTEETEKTNLYLFFEQKTNLLIRPIELDGYYSGHGEEEEELRESDIHSFPVPNIFKTCIRLGSQILFGIGQYTLKDICWVDMSTHPLKIHVSSPTDTKIKSFKTPKSRMLWGVIDGQIYCLHNCFDHEDSGPPFEVLDPKIDNAKWQSLSQPPFIWDDDSQSDEKYRYSALFLNRSKKILGWEHDKSGVLCFDTTKPKNGWVESPRSLGDSIPFIGYDTTRLVVEDYHPKLGNFNLVFSYDRFDEPFVVHPFFISENCDSFQAIDQLIRLPKLLCSKYRVSYVDAESKRGTKGKSFDSEFVHLGDKKFCLVLHKFVQIDYDDRSRTKAVVLVLTYEYDFFVNDDYQISEDSKPELKIKTRLLGVRQFTSCLRKRSTHRLAGAFVF